ncbi:MAG TPA: BBP7 family outer membrane beta-barrel protein [Gemmataceae bacterium]|nr:BBP7 family outer membrane beta-barrel protein [Gemmataceae bacterium]
MRLFLAGSLVVGMAWWSANATAQEAKKTLAPIGAPVARADEVPLVTLGRPVAIKAATDTDADRNSITDRQVTPATFIPPLLGAPEPVVSGPSSDTPQPLPSGPALDTDPPSPAKQSGQPAVPEKLGVPRVYSGTSDQPPAPGLLTSRLRPMPVNSDDCDGCADCADDCTGMKPWFQRWRCEESSKDVSCFWFSGEYLLWWVKGGQLPPLVTTSPAGTPRDMAGVLGQPGTQVLFGGNATQSEPFSGGRFNFGFWFDRDQIIGLETSTFFLGERSMNFAASSFGSPILARPFYDVVAGQQSSELIAFPGVLAGNIAITSSTELWGTELNLRTNFWRGCCWRIDFLAGFRYLHLGDDLSINENLTVPTGALAGSEIAVGDSFRTQNDFYGGQIGTEIEFRKGPWSLDLTAKVAVGDTQQFVNIAGATTFAPSGGPVSAQPGGLFALPTNIGMYSRDQFSIVPEAGFKVSYKLTDCCRAFVAYSLLYDSNVVRPGSVIDSGVNVSQLSSQLGPGMLVGPARPAPVFHTTDFWAQGISVGLEFRY